MIGAGKNIDPKTVEGFGQEWEKFSHKNFDQKEKAVFFEKYFSIFPAAHFFTKDKIGADIGCGSGRWATLIAPLLHTLHLVDASEKALSVAKKNLQPHNNVRYHLASVDNLPIPDASLDFAYSLGVLHHVPQTEDAIQQIAKKLKQGSPLLLYLYYNFDNRPLWYRIIWLVTDILRSGISKLPFPLRLFFCHLIALFLYFPLARLAKVLERFKHLPPNWPLAFYRNASFYVMKTDALDRFGTRLEQRFSRAQIKKMFENSGFERIEFSTKEPYWVAVGYKMERSIDV